MDRQQLIEKVKAMPWEIWVHRRFSPFVTYFMMYYATPAAFASEGIEGQFPIVLYDTDDWYSTPEMFTLAGKEAEKFLRKKDIFTLTRQCEEILERGRIEIPKLRESTAPARDLFIQALDLIKPANTYIWVAHASEAYYHPILQREVAKHVPAEKVETFIGDIGFPSKKNALALMEDDIRAGMPAHKLHGKYAWIKARGGFTPGYTLKEMEEIKDKILHSKPQTHVTPPIPPELEPLAREIQELVYLRTLRTDALYEMYYLARPIFERYARELGIESVKDYLPEDLLAGRPNYIPPEYCMFKWNDEVVVLRESIISKAGAPTGEVKGVVAHRGCVRGTVRIVRTPAESDRVETGDVLVTNMTIPAYISAMHRAAAFVTDEGGITCHAAIIARELKKPCIIGTKVATRILKDGDIVEVDAETGVVKKIH